MSRKFVIIQILTILLFFISVSYPQAQEARHFGLGTGPRTFKVDIKYAKNLGIDTLRLTLQWQLIEPRPGEFDWSKVDRAVEAAQAKQIEILFTLRCISSWGTKKETQAKGIYHSGSMPLDIKEWVRFLEALANRYKGRGVDYEIENEVNGLAFWSGTLEEYLDLLKVSYSAIKQADPQAKVLSSAMGCGIVRNFQSEADQNKAWSRHDMWLWAILSAKAFDVISVHNYYFPSEIVANGRTFRSYLEHIRDLMKEAQVEDRPIWITETGYVSRPTNASGRMDNGSAEKQAKWLKEAYAQAFEMGIERIFWLMLRDRNEAYFGSMGLVDAQRKARPACKTLQQLTKAREAK